jgi:hypothetical protein
VPASSRGLPAVRENTNGAPSRPPADDARGVTGFLCPDRAALVAAVDRLPGLDRAACRRDVAERFCTARMVAEHLALYEDLMRR